MADQKNHQNSTPYTHCGKVFGLIDRRFAIYRPLQESLVGRRHANEENATVIRNLHRGGAECRGDGGDASSVPEASYPSRKDAPLAETADSARRRQRRALCFPIQITLELTRQSPCALHTPSRRTWRIRRSGICPQPISGPWHARSVAVAAAALLHAVVMLAAGAVFLSCCHCVTATGYDLARPSISALTSTQGRQPTDPPLVTRHAERRKLREARSLRAFLDNFSRNLAIQEEYGFVVRKNAYRYTIRVWSTVQKSDRPRVQNV